MSTPFEQPGPGDDADDPALRDEDGPQLIPPPRFRRSGWAFGLALTYLVAICVISLFSRLVAERLWWTTLLIYVPQVAYLAPVPLVFIVVLWSQDRRALAAFVATVRLIVGPVMGLQVPLPELTQPGEQRVRVLSYNIKGALGGFDRISDQIAAVQPDVVVFSEARGWSDDSVIERQLQEQFRGWDSVIGGDVYIASRWPFVNSESQPLGKYTTHDPSLDRKKVRALVQAPFGRFQVVGVHFRTAVYGRTLIKEIRNVPRYMKHTGAVRREQTDDLIAWTTRMSEPVILAGDFNTPPAGSIYRSLTGPFGDAFAERGSGWGYTFPANRPLLRIDYIYHSRDWRVVRCKVGPEHGSDHRSVFAELALRKSAQ
ncbi:MAG: Endonuclease/exonuclease/phosphatase [Armatimonadetes bacterium]|nr:Endonuclease/exonuclease/phosphatase [Armatimonadota bacterium]